MSLLNDARRLSRTNESVFVHFDTDGEPYPDGDPYAAAYLTCVFCSVRLAFRSDEPFVHRTVCPILSMPKIVAVLEAAERYVSLNGRDDVSMTDIMHAEDDLHAAFGHARRYDVEEIKT